MKRLFLFLVIILILGISLIYILIPSNLVVSKAVTINCTLNGAYRNISEEHNWENRWLINDSTLFSRNKNIALHDTNSYHITKILSDGADITIKNKNATFYSRVELFTQGKDSALFEWRCIIHTGINPFKKIMQYRDAVNIKYNMDETAEYLRIFLSNQDNIYGMPIRLSFTKDTFLITTKYITPAFPDTKDIYKYLDVLKKYISIEGAVETNYPMLNVTRLSNDSFQTMVAIPVNKKLPVKDNISPRLLVNGHFMETEIHGGPYAINNAFKQMQFYFDDYEKTSMAIPFQSLVTDRTKESDTSKWITKLYAPVMK